VITVPLETRKQVGVTSKGQGTTPEAPSSDGASPYRSLALPGASPYTGASP